MEGWTHDIMLHRDDPEDPGEQHDATRVGGALEVEVSCPRCGVRPLVVKLLGEPVSGSGEQGWRYRYAAAGCQTCGRHVGTVRATKQAYWAPDEDDRVIGQGGRARVYLAGKKGGEEG